MENNIIEKAKNLKIYAEYGCLSHEYVPVWHLGSSSTWGYDLVEIPQEWEQGHNCLDDLLLRPEGCSHFQIFQEMLDQNRNDTHPWLTWYDDDGRCHHRKLKVIQSAW